MNHQECRCPKCGKLLGKLTMIDGSRAILEAYCKNCKQLVDVVVKRQEAA